MTDYLLKYGKTYPTWYIAQKWQLSEGMVRHRLHKLGIHRTWAQSVALPLAKFKLPQYRKELSSKLKQTFQTRKRQRLLDYATQYGKLESIDGPAVLDVRGDLIVTPRTARNKPAAAKKESSQTK